MLCVEFGVRGTTLVEEVHPSNRPCQNPRNRFRYQHGSIDSVPGSATPALCVRVDEENEEVVVLVLVEK